MTNYKIAVLTTGSTTPHFYDVLAMMISTGVTAAYAAVQGALNVVMAANPIGLIVIALVGLVAGLIYAYKHSETFRDIVNGVWEKVKEGASALLGFFTDTLWPGIKNVWDWISDAIGTAWDWIVTNVWNPMRDFVTVTVPGWWNTYLDAVRTVNTMIGDAIGAAWNWIVNNVWNPVRDFLTVTIPGYWNAYVDLVRASWDLFSNIISTGWQWIVDNVWNPVRDFLTVTIPGYWNAYVDLVNAVWEAYKALIKAGWDWIVTNVWTPVQTYLTVTLPAVWEVMRAAVSIVWDAVKTLIKAGWDWLTTNVWVPVATFLTVTLPGYFETGRAFIGQKWTAVQNLLKTGWDWIVTNVWNPLSTFVTSTIPGYFTTGVDAIGRIWNTLRDKVSGPINTMKGWINDNLIGPLNTVTKLFGLTIPALSGGGGTSTARNMANVAGRASGGMIYGPGTGTSDSILGLDAAGIPTARVSAGEYIVKRSAVQKYGTGFLDQINVGRFAEGGFVENVMGWLNNGAKFASDQILGGARNLISRAVPAPEFANRMAVGSIDKLKELIGARAKEYDDTAAAMVGDAFNPNGKSSPNGVGGLGPAAAAARAFVMKTFGVSNIGGYAKRNIAGTGTVSDHALGKAIDVMIPNYRSAGGIALGNQIAAHFVQNPGQFGTKYVIWRDQINSGGGWRAYRHPGGGTSDTLQHRDHVHVSVFDKGGLLDGMGVNLSGRPERVLDPRQTAAFERWMDAGSGGGDLVAEFRALRQELLMRPTIAQTVYNPIAEPASQTAQRQLTRSALLT